MRLELEQKLINKYPKIFTDCGTRPEQSCMAFGIETGDGWYNLIDMLCSFIQTELDQGSTNSFQLIAVQVKEKMGGLRFYYQWVSNDNENKGLPSENATTMGNIEAVICFAEKMSYTICEQCGAPGDISSDGWIQTLCDKCRGNNG